MIDGGRAETTGMTKILVADRRDIFAMGLAAALETEGFEVETVVRGHLVDQACGELPDTTAVVMDVVDDADLKELSIVAEGDAAGIVAVLEQSAPALTRAALRAGAHALASRETSIAGFVLRVQAALAGDVVVSRPMLDSVLFTCATAGCDCERLSESEVSILRWLVAGVTVSELAARLNRSERDTHRVLGRVWDRMGVRNRTEAIVHAARCGLFEDQP